MMAANRSPLGERVMRLLGWNGTAGRIRVAGLAGSFVCLWERCWQPTRFLGVAHAAWGSAAPGRQEQGSSSVIVVTPEPASAKERAAQAANQRPLSNPHRNRNRTRPANRRQGTMARSNRTWMRWAAAGVKITDVERTHFPEDSGRNARIHQGDARSWMQPNAEELIGMKVQASPGIRSPRCGSLIERQH